MAIADHGTFDAAARALHITPIRRVPADPDVGVRGGPGGGTPVGPVHADRGWRGAAPIGAPDPAAPGRSGRRVVGRSSDAGGPAGRRQRRFAGDLVPRRDGRGGRVVGPGAAPARGGPGPHGRPLARRGRAGRRHLRGGGGAGVHVGDSRLAALRAGRRAGSGRPFPPRPRCRLGANAGGGVQREGPAAGRHPRRPAASRAHPWCTGCRPPPTSWRRSASASAGAPSPSRSSSRRLPPAGWCGSRRAATSTYRCTGSAGGSSHRPWSG